jgi:hypothetical protein
MITQEVHRVGQQLDEIGHALTSFEALGLPFPKQDAHELQQALSQTEQVAQVEEEGRTGMLMHRDEQTLALNGCISLPIAQLLFPGHPTLREDMGTYAVNQYDTGELFNPHQDHFDGTVMISTIAGTRRFNVYEKELEDDVFNTISASHVVSLGSIVLLNGYKNLGHAAECLEGPSISVVADVPYPMNIYR